MIVRDDEIRLGDPRIEGTRITVSDIKHRVIDGGEDAFTVAAEYDLDPVSVFAALTYYYENAEAMRTLEVEHEEHVEKLERESRKIRDRYRQDAPSEEAYSRF